MVRCCRTARLTFNEDSRPHDMHVGRRNSHVVFNRVCKMRSLWTVHFVRNRVIVFGLLAFVNSQ